MKYRIRMFICFLGCMLGLMTIFLLWMSKLSETLRADDWSFLAYSFLIMMMILQAENISAPTGDPRDAPVRWWHRRSGRTGSDQQP